MTKKKRLPRYQWVRADVDGVQGYGLVRRGKKRSKNRERDLFSKHSEHFCTHKQIGRLAK